MIFQSVNSLFFVFFLLLVRPNWATPVLESLPSDTVAIAVEQTLKLTWNFTEIVGNEYNIFWKKDNQAIGRCQNPYQCEKYPIVKSDTRIKLNEFDRQSFQLRIDNINNSDAGSYECGYEDRNDKLKQYSLHRVDVIVMPKEQPSSSHVSTLSSSHDSTPSSSHDSTPSSSHDSTPSSSHDPTPSSSHVSTPSSSHVSTPSSSHDSTPSSSHDSTPSSSHVSTPSDHSWRIRDQTPGDHQQDESSLRSTQITVSTKETGGKSDKIHPLPSKSVIMLQELQASSINQRFLFLIYFCFTISTTALIFAAFALWRTFRSRNNNPDKAQDVEQAEETKKGATGTGTGVYDVIDPIVPSGTNNHVSILDNQEQETPFRYHLQNGLHRAHSEIRDGVAMNTSCPGPSVPKRRTQSEYKGHHSSDDYDHLHRKQMKKFSLPGDSLFALGIAEEDIDDNPINGPTCKSRSLNDAVKVDELVANPSCSRRGEEKMEKSSNTDSTTAGTKDSHNYHVLEKLSCPGPEEESAEETDGTVNARANNNDPTKLEYDPGYDNLRSAKGKNMTTKKYEEIDMSN